jgi:hypothetical protein
MTIENHRRRFASAPPRMGSSSTAIPTPPPLPPALLAGSAGVGADGWPSGIPWLTDLDVVFRETNTVSAEVRYKKNNPLELSVRMVGICASLSTLWLANMFTQTNPAATKPNQARAGIMFSKNRITKSGRARTLANIDDAGLKSIGFWTYDGLYELFADINVNLGYYLIELSEGHYIAVVRRGLDAFLYDSNHYCKKYTATIFAGLGVANLTRCSERWSKSQTLWVDQVALKQ